MTAHIKSMLVVGAWGLTLLLAGLRAIGDQPEAQSRFAGLLVPLIYSDITTSVHPAFHVLGRNSETLLMVDENGCVWLRSGKQDCDPELADWVTNINKDGER